MTLPKVLRRSSHSTRDQLIAPSGNEFRIMCPLCETMWTTRVVPSECPECAASISFSAKPQRK